MRKLLSTVALVLALVLVLGILPVAYAADPPEPFSIVEARLVTEVLDWGETITALRIEYNDEIYNRDIWYSLEHADKMTYKMVSNRDIVNIYVNNSGKKDDIQLQGKYVFINFGTECEDFTTYREQVLFQNGRGTRTRPVSYYFTQSLPITSVNGRVAPPRTMSTASSAMTAAKNAALPDLNGTLGPDVREVRTADTEVRVTLDKFRTFEYTNPVTGTKLKFHLYIPPGYDVDRAANTGEALPMVVHFPNGGDANYADDEYVEQSERRYMGALYSHPDATYWATDDAQERNPSFVLTMAGTGAATYGNGLPAANWGTWYENSQMQQDYIAAIRWIKERFKVDEDRVGAINLAASANAMLGTILSDEVDDFSACIITAYDLYHSFTAGNLATPIGGTAQTTYEGRMQYAEEQFSRVMNKVATWQFNGLNDRTGMVAGDTTYAGMDPVHTTYQGRFKGERGFDWAYRMNKAAGKTVVVSNDYDTMWNGMINLTPSTNQALKSSENEIKAQAQWDEAKRVGAEHLVTVFMPGTIPQTNHWSWNSPYGNLVVQDWLYAQNRTTHAGFPIGHGAEDYTPQSPRTPRDVPDDAGTATMVEARLVTEVLDWGETITAIRIEYSEEVRADAVEYSVEHADRQTYQMATDRDIVNLYVNNSGKKDDYQTQGKYVFINLGLESEDFTSYRDQVCFDTSLRIRPRPNPYYLYQAFPIITVNGNVIQPRSITTATSAIRGTLMDTSELPNITQMDVWSTEVRMTLDGFRTFTYTNPANDSQTKFHLYIPEGYEKKDSGLSDIPLVVHFPSGDTAYVDDSLGNANASRQMGSLFTHPDATVWASDKAQAEQKAFVLTPGPNWNSNYMYIVKALVENLNIDISRIYAISLAAGSTTQWNTILANPGVFAAQIGTAYDPYHAFAGGSDPYEVRIKNAEDTFARIMDELPGWFFIGLTDGSGSPLAGDPEARLKGDRWRDFAFLMNTRGYNIDVSWGDKGELMWNGMLRGQKAEAQATSQINRANASGADQLLTLFHANTVLQTAHWSWNAAYTNAVVRNWLYTQVNPDPAGTANIDEPVPPDPVYTISFDPGNGTVDTETMVTGTDGKLASLPTATWSGYIFKGWFTQTYGGDKITTDTVFTSDITVYAQWEPDINVIDIKTQPVALTTFTQGDISGSLSLEADVSNGVALSYQWYSNTLASNQGGTPISGATSAAFNIPKALKPGVYFYYCVVSAEGAQDIASNVATVQVVSWVNPYSDVFEKDWFYDAVRFVTVTKLMNGTGDNKFSPNDTMSRAMLVTVLYRLEREPAISGNIDFPDVKEGEWYSNAILWAQQNDIVTGYTDGTFGLNDPVTREQTVTILYRYAKAKGLDVTSADDLSKYTDMKEISDYALNAIKWAVAEGIINGRTDTTIEPKGMSTRAEAATIFNRYIEDFLG